MSSPTDKNRREMVIIGAGTYGSVIRELAESCGYGVVGFLDDDAAKWGTDLDGLPVSGPISSALDDAAADLAVAVAIGNNTARLAWLLAAQLRGREIPCLLSPWAIVSPSAQIGDAVYLHPGSHVWTQARIGLGSILSPHATVAHHTVLGQACFVSTGANVGASINVGEGALFGIGSTTSTGVRLVGAHTLVGAGAVIIRDTTDFGVYVGSPGRLIKVQKP